jgi:hypothetical protein
VTFKTGGGDAGGTDGDPYLTLFFKDGSSCVTRQIGPNDTGNDTRFGKPGFNDFEEGQTDIFSLRPDRVFQWKDLRGFVIGLEDGGDWQLDRFKMIGFTSDNLVADLYDNDINQIIPNDTILQELITKAPPAAAAKAPEPKIEMFVSPEDLLNSQILIEHFQSESHYYRRLLWLSEDPNARAERFETETVFGRSLLDIVENRPLEVTGQWVAFPINVGMERFIKTEFDIEQEDPNLTLDSFVEQLLTLPTRGVFGEAKLGHCNASEIIDTSRFWDWQTSPIPDQTPEITGISGESRKEKPTDLTPTAFPNSLVNIVNPQSLPDPTGLSAGLNLLGSLGAFRDMSTAKEVGPLLQTLSNNATQLAAEGLKGAQTQKLMDTIRNSKELSGDQKTNLIRSLLTGQVEAMQPGSNNSSKGGTGGTGAGGGTGGTGAGGGTGGTGAGGGTGGTGAGGGTGGTGAGGGTGGTGAGGGTGGTGAGGGTGGTGAGGGTGGTGAGGGGTSPKPKPTQPVKVSDKGLNLNIFVTALQGVNIFGQLDIAEIYFNDGTSQKFPSSNLSGSGVNLHTDKAMGGRILIRITQQVRPFDTYISDALKNAGTSIKSEPFSRTFQGACVFSPPTSGNIISIVGSPEVVTTTVTAKSGREAAQKIGADIGLTAKLVSLGFSVEDSTTTSTATEKQYPIQVLVLDPLTQTFVLKMEQKTTP